MTPNQPELLPCPFCGSTNITWFLNQVCCDACGCGTLQGDSQEEVRELWNKRPKSDAPVEAKVSEGISEAISLIKKSEESCKLVWATFAREKLEDTISKLNPTKEAP